MLRDATPKLGALLAALLLAVASVAVAQSGQQPALLPGRVLAEEAAERDGREWIATRDESLRTLVKIAGGSPSSVGFEKAPNLHELTVLKPIPEALVLLSDLKKYEDRNPPDELLRDARRLTFPVVRGHEVLSSITLSDVEGTWQPVTYGGSSIIRAAMRARVELGNRSRALRTPHAIRPRPPEKAKYRLVMVTGLNHYFLAAEGTKGLLLTPLFENAQHGFRAGVPLPAKEVFLKLRPDAQAYTWPEQKAP
jgi:hypothetical protein